MKKKDIIIDIDLIIGRNQEVTDDTHMDLVDEIADYVELQVKKKSDLIDSFILATQNQDDKRIDDLLKQMIEQQK